MEIIHLGKNDFNESILLFIKKLLDESYTNSKMFVDLKLDLEKKLDYFKAIILQENGELLGFCVIESENNETFLKRVTINKNFRSKGYGKILIDEAKKIAFEELNLNYLKGKSSESGAIYFYLREGAVFSKTNIENISERNSKDENLYFFSKIIFNKDFKKYRFPIGHGFLFVFSKDEKIKNEFLQNGFIDKNYLENLSKK